MIVFTGAAGNVAVQRLLGRPPRAFAQWAETYAHLFASR
jgi:hypothetical protein